MSDEERDQTEELKEFGDQLLKERGEKQEAPAETKDEAPHSVNAGKAADANQAVENTVKDLQKKIQEISADDPAKDEEDAKSDKGLNIPDFHLKEDQKEKIKEVKTEASRSMNAALGQLREKASDITENVDFSKTLKFLKENAFKAVDAAKEKIDEFAENPDVKEKTQIVQEKAEEARKTVGEKAEEARKTVTEKAEAAKRNVSEKAGGLFSEEQKQKVSQSLSKAQETVRETYSGLVSDEKKKEIQDNLKKAGETINDGFKAARKSASEFVSKPEVQEALNKTKDLAQEGVDKIKDLLNSK